MTRVIVIVLEGAEPTLIERWRANLPTLARLADEHVFAPMLADAVPYEAPGLATAFTGFPPTIHGYYSMWKIHPERVGCRSEVVSSNEIGAPYIWERPEFGDMRCLVANVIGTHPPRPVNGRLITHPFYTTTTASYPKPLLLELSKAGTPFVQDVSIFLGRQDPNTFKKLVLEAEVSRCRAYRQMLRDSAELTVLNLTVIDRLSHFFWNEVDLYDEDSVLHAAYRIADGFLGEVGDDLGSKDELLVFSEFGFGPLAAYISVNQILHQAGLLAMEGGSLDTSRTLAFEAVQGSHGVNLSLQRRYPNGVVPPGREALVLRETQEALLAARNPITSAPLFRSTASASQLFGGSADARAPDIIVIPYDEQYPPLGDPLWASHVSRRCQTGWHRRESFWAGTGPLLSKAAARRARLLDIAPTIYAMLGLETSAFPGTSLLVDRI